MSLYLGKIHYWLFNKILWLQNLEENIIQSAQENGVDIETAKNKIIEQYGEKLKNKNLDEIIDLNNIHGWLQNTIHISEGRLAAWIGFIIKSDINAINNLKAVFEEGGIIAANEAKDEAQYSTAIEIYNCVTNYILDGMPCDRVNVVTISEENLVSWERRLCVHKEVWEKENVDVKIFYDLRKSWLETFVKNLNPSFEYSEESEGSYKIKKG
ncbi:hypothetical protein [Cetobacterium sp.]|uniref:hypothetical protein n=1 Tax=Cetobacterium sp. TaxID=2071632 RepID=UPI003F3B1717